MLILEKQYVPPNHTDFITYLFKNSWVIFFQVQIILLQVLLLITIL